MKRSQVNLRNALTDKMLTKQDVEDLTPALLGAYTTVGQQIVIPGRPDFCYARLRGNNSEVVEVFNDTALRRFNWPVKLRWASGRWEVVGRNTAGQPQGFGGYPGLANHAAQHEFYTQTGTNDLMGDDVVWVNKRQWMPLNLTPTNPETMKARVWSDYFMWAGAYHWYPGSDTADFTSLVPAGGINSRFITVYIDGAEVLHYVTGTLFAYTGAIQDPEPLIALPGAGAGIVLGAVLLNAGYATIDWGQIWDMRAVIQGFADPGTGTHTPVTLTADADLTFILNGQEIGIEEQSSNEFWATPTGTVGTAVPVWRVIDKDDIPTTLGSITFQNVTINTLTASTAIYSNASKQIVSLANAVGYLTNNGAGALSWSATTPPSVHNVLDSTYHGDVLTGTITRGDILYGNATPKIARLALGGITGSVLTRDATDVEWSTGALSFGGAFTLTISNNASIGGTAITGTPGTLTVSTANLAADPHTHAITSVNVATAAANILACDAAGGLQLTKLGVGAAYNATNPVSIAQSFTDAAGAENRGFVVALTILRTGNGSSGICPALQFNSEKQSSFNETGALLGVDGKVVNSSANYLQYAYGARVNTTNSGASYIAVAHGVDIAAIASAGKIVEWEGVYVNSSSGTVDFARGIYIGTITGTYQGYAIYSAAASSYSWHAGNWAIGGAARIPTVTLDAVLNNATTNAINEIARITHNSTGTAANGFGSALDWYLESSTTADQQAARISVLWYEATHLSRKADLVLSAWGTSECEGIRIRGGAAPAIGLYGIATPVVRATTAGASAAFVQNSGNAVNDASTIGGYTLLQVVQALQNIGVLT